MECGFSRGGLTVTKLRHRLADRSVRASTILGAWLRSGIPEIVQESELIEVIKNKQKRPKNGKGKQKAVDPESDDSDSVEVVS